MMGNNSASWRLAIQHVGKFTESILKIHNIITMNHGATLIAVVHSGDLEQHERILSSVTTKQH